MLAPGEVLRGDEDIVGSNVTVLFDETYKTNLDGSSWLNLLKDNDTDLEEVDYGFYMADSQNRNTSKYMYDLVYTNYYEEDEDSE